MEIQNTKINRNWGCRTYALHPQFRILLLTLLLAACAPAEITPNPDLPVLMTQQAIPSATPGSTEEPTALPQELSTNTPPPAQLANQITLGIGQFGIAISLGFPEGFSGNIEADTIPALGIQNPGDPAYPEHGRIIFAEYAGDNRDNTAQGIRVFRVTELEAFELPVLDRFNAVMSGQHDQHLDFPSLPGAGNLVDAKEKILPFQNGNGYRYLSMGSFSANALAGTRLFYLYQGMTGDGAYYVTLLMTVDAPFIADLATGQAFASASETQQYITTLNERLNAAQAGEFNPSLIALDALTGSIGITTR